MNTDSRLSCRHLRRMTDSEVTLWRNDSGYLIIDTGDNLVTHHRLLTAVHLGPDELAGQDVHHRTGVKIDIPENIESIERSKHNQLHADGDRLLEPKDVF